MTSAAKTKVRFTVTLPDGTIWFQSVEFPMGPGLNLGVEMKPLFDWLADRLGPWL